VIGGHDPNVECQWMDLRQWEFRSQLLVLLRCAGLGRSDESSTDPDTLRAEHERSSETTSIVDTASRDYVNLQKPVSTGPRKQLVAHTGPPVRGDFLPLQMSTQAGIRMEVGVRPV